MAFPINAGDSFFYSLIPNSILAEIGRISEQLEPPTTEQVASSPSLPTLTTEALQSFSVTLDEINQVFTQADAFQTFTGQGNQQLTQQEIRFYLERNYQQLQSTAQGKIAALALLFLNHYFDRLADINTLTSLGEYRAISSDLIEHLASLDGDSTTFSFEDIDLYLKQKIDLAQSISHQAMGVQDAAMIQKAGERQAPMLMPIKKQPEPKGLEKYQPKLVEMVHRTQEIDLQQKPNQPEAPLLAMQMQEFSFSIDDILLLLQSKKGQIHLQEIERVTKIVDAHLLDLEKLMQTLAYGPHPQIHVSKPLLSQQLEQARRSSRLLRILKLYFNEIAEIDGDPTSISRADIEFLAALDGHAEDLTLKDLLKLRKQ